MRSRLTTRRSLLPSLALFASVQSSEVRKDSCRLFRVGHHGKSQNNHENNHEKPQHNHGASRIITKILFCAAKSSPVMSNSSQSESQPGRHSLYRSVAAAAPAIRRSHLLQVCSNTLKTHSFCVQNTGLRHTYSFGKHAKTQENTPPQAPSPLSVEASPRRRTCGEVQENCRSRTLRISTEY